MSRIPASALLAAAIVLATVAPASAQDWKGRGRVNGIVTDQEGNPVKGALVRMRMENNPDSGPEDLTTDRKGRWSILGLLGGTWTVMIQAEGYNISEGSVHVNEYGVNPLVRVELNKAKGVAGGDPKLEAAAKAVQEADAFLQAHQATEAREAYERALPAFEGANRLLILKRIATCQMIEGNDESAVATLKTVLAESPDDLDAMRLLIDRLIVLKREDEAQQYMAKMPEGAHLDPNTMLNMGINMYNDNQLEAAHEKFDQVVNIKPDWPDGYYYRGLASLGLGNVEPAKADFEKVLELDPSYKYAAECKEFLKSL